MNIIHTDMEAMDKRYKTTFVNSLSGFKSLFLISSINSTGDNNLAIFNSVIHIGANPPLLGFISRPNSVDRHTLENIREVKKYTLNSVDLEFYEKGHHTAARYDRGQSEFEMAGLNREYINGNDVPFVRESSLKIEMEFKETCDIQSNGTHLVIGEVRSIYLPDGIIEDDGYINLEKMGVLTGSGLDAYHTTNLIRRLAYAKPKS